MNNRNEYIDYLKGIAAIGIIAIHTAFWSGQSYIPEWFCNLTLFLDVPFFFYLSGWGGQYSNRNVEKTLKSLGKIWLKWIYFILLISVFCILSYKLPLSFQGVSDFRDLVNNFFFNVSIPGFCVIGGSIWYLPYYFVVILSNTIIMCLIARKENENEVKKIYTIMLGVVFLWICYGKYFFGLDLQYFLFYSFFWMLGMNGFGKTKTFYKFVLAIIISLLGIIIWSYLQGLPLYDLQSAKFPPTMKYGCASMLVIIIAKYFEMYKKTYNKFLVHIGKNAIWYYFGQGVGSSLCYIWVDKIQLNYWFVKWLIIFVINIFITICIAEFLNITYGMIQKIVCCKLHHFTTL